MKLPRDVSARQLINALAQLGYIATRQSGSHVRRACVGPPPHAVTVPNRSPLKVGTLNAILAEVAAHQRMDKAVLIERLFS